MLHKVQEKQNYLRLQHHITLSQTCLFLQPRFQLHFHFRFSLEIGLQRLTDYYNRFDNYYNINRTLKHV